MTPTILEAEQEHDTWPGPVELQTCEQFPMFIKQKLSVQFLPSFVGERNPGKHAHVVFWVFDVNAPVHIVLFPHVFIQ